jgi:hypothetical protein
MTATGAYAQSLAAALAARGEAKCIHGEAGARIERGKLTNPWCSHCAARAGEAR